MGVTFSMVAVSYTEAGIAQTLMSLMPILIIPIVWLLYKEKTNWRGIFGAITAVVGVAILFLI
jgi:drug/metabolite transporter (DMT)-like permease